jgi:hydroxymethylbilane synthase
MKKLVFATRPSALARWQTQAVIAALQARNPGLICIEQVITTQGDRIMHLPLPEIGGKGLFTDELEAALLSAQVDCAVHSLKDLPVTSSPDLTIGCIPERGGGRGVVVSARGYTLQSSPPGSVVGTSSLRRSA